MLAVYCCQLAGYWKSLVCAARWIDLMVLWARGRSWTLSYACVLEITPFGSTRNCNLYLLNLLSSSQPSPLKRFCLAGTSSPSSVPSLIDWQESKHPYSKVWTRFAARTRVHYFWPRDWSELFSDSGAHPDFPACLPPRMLRHKRVFRSAKAVPPRLLRTAIPHYSHTEPWITVVSTVIYSWTTVAEYRLYNRGIQSIDCNSECIFHYSSSRNPRFYSLKSDAFS